MRRVRATIVAVENNEYCILRGCVCSLRYPASNAHAPYCHLWSAGLYSIFPHYLINDTIFRGKKKLLNIMCGLIFSSSFFYEVLFILRRTERDMIKMCIYIFIKYPLFLSGFNET